MEISSTAANIAVAQYQPQQAQAAQTTKTADVQQQANSDTISLETAQRQQVAVADKIQINSVTLKNLDTVKAIEQMHARMNQMVKGARETNEEINKLSEQISQLQGNITTMKNFPPFPVDSKERQEILMSYSSIRQEILRMTVPNPPAPLFEQVKDLWNSTFGQNGQMLASAVPALEAGSNDKQLQATAGQLEKIGQNLADLSSGITHALINP